jgi:hypothetical protein
MTERKVYCRNCKHYIPLHGCGDECTTKPISEDEYAVPQERNINNDCKYYRPTLLHRLKEWLTIKYKCNSCKWFNNKDCNIHGSTGIAYPVEYNKNNDCKHFELSLCKLFKEWLKGVFK